MEISERVRQLLPAQYEIDAQDIQCFRTFDAVKLPDASRTPTDFGWLWRGPVSESYFLAVDEQISMPEQQTIVLNIKLEYNNLAFGRAAFWRGHIWGYSAVGMGSGNVQEWADWHWWSSTVFHRVLSMRDNRCFTQRVLSAIDDRNQHWIQVARSDLT